MKSPRSLIVVAVLVAGSLLGMLAFTVIQAENDRAAALRTARHTTDLQKARVDALTATLGQVRLELGQVLAATTDAQRQAIAKSFADTAKSPAPTSTSRPPPAPPRPATTPATSPPAPPSTTTPKPQPCTTLPVVNRCL